MKRILCIWLPHWPIQRLAAAQQGRERREGRGEREEGRRERGEGRGEHSTLSKILLQQPDLQLDICNWQFAISSSAEPRDPLADREALLDMAAWCHQFSPVVGVEDSPAPESLFLDITGLDSLFGGEAALAEKVVRDFAARGLAVRVAVADTLGAAWAVARFGNCKFSRSHGLRGSARSAMLYVAALDAERREAGSHAERGNQVHAERGNQALGPLPIEALRLPAETVELLHSLGVYRIEQLGLLPRDELSCRFGPRLVQRWDQAVGRLAEPIPVEPLPPRFAARQVMEYPVASREAVSLALERLVARVAEMLIGRGRGAARLECRLECQAAGPVCFSVGLFQPTASPRHLLQLIQMHLERLALASPVIAVSLEATLTGPLDQHQEELFADHPSRGRLRLLSLLVDRLASRLGRGSVLRPRLLPEAQPELAYIYDPLVPTLRAAAHVPPLRGAGERRRRASLAARSHAERGNEVLLRGSEVLPPRPLRLLRQPIALAVISVMPDGPPFSFRLRGREHRIVQFWGPERIETGWWRGRAIGRDYYRVETVTGQRFWLFRSLDDGRWFLHGNFQ